MTPPTVRLSLGFPLSAAAESDVGRVRENNEDNYAIAWCDDGALLAVVADGMGGHLAGEVASAIAVQEVERQVRARADLDPATRLGHAVLEANERIAETAYDRGLAGMGTTVVAALVYGREAWVAHVGDSRLFHVRRGHMLWRTHDHTRVQELIDMGVMAEEDARSHPDAGMLTRAMGHRQMADGRPLTADMRARPIVLEEGDALVLTSDGAHDVLDDWEVAQLAAGLDAAAAVERLVQEPVVRSGHDNTTALVVVAGGSAADYDPSWVYETAQPEPTELEPTEDTACTAPTVPSDRPAPEPEADWVRPTHAPAAPERSGAPASTVVWGVVFATMAGLAWWSGLFTS